MRLAKQVIDKQKTLEEVRWLLTKDYYYWYHNYYLVMKDMQDAVAQGKSLNIQLQVISGYEKQLNYLQQLQKNMASRFTFLAEQFKRWRMNDMNYIERIEFSTRVKKGTFQKEIDSAKRLMNEQTKLVETLKSEYAELNNLYEILTLN